MKKQTVKILTFILMFSLLIVGIIAPMAMAESKPKIVVFVFRPSGVIVEAFKAYIKSIEKELDFVGDVRFCGHQGSDLYKNVESAIAEGAKGILYLTDKGNTNEIVDLCSRHGVYVGGAWHNQGASLNTSKAGYNFLVNKFYVGHITDGPDDMSTSFPIYAKIVAAKYNKLNAADKEWFDWILHNANSMATCTAICY